MGSEQSVLAAKAGVAPTDTNDPVADMMWNWGYNRQSPAPSTCNSRASSRASSRCSSRGPTPGNSRHGGSSFILFQQQQQGRDEEGANNSGATFFHREDSTSSCGSSMFDWGQSRQMSAAPSIAASPNVSTHGGKRFLSTSVHGGTYFGGDGSSSSSFEPPPPQQQSGSIAAGHNGSLREGNLFGPRGVVQVQHANDYHRGLQ